MLRSCVHILHNYRNVAFITWLKRSLLWHSPYHQQMFGRCIPRSFMLWLPHRFCKERPHEVSEAPAGPRVLLSGLHLPEEQGSCKTLPAPQPSQNALLVGRRKAKKPDGHAGLPSKVENTFLCDMDEKEPVSHRPAIVCVFVKCPVLCGHSSSLTREEKPGVAVLEATEICGCVNC